MRIVHDREDARWLPSRFHFALFRLFAFVRMMFTRPQERRGIIIAIDREQSTIEHYTISLWYFASVSCLLSAIVPLGVAIVLSTFLVQVPLFLIGLGQRVNSWILMSSATIGAAYLATTHTWIRFAAWQFLAIVVLNTVAELIMLALRDAVKRMEARCGL